MSTVPDPQVPPSGGGYYLALGPHYVSRGEIRFRDERGRDFLVAIITIEDTQPRFFTMAERTRFRQLVRYANDGLELEKRETLKQRKTS